METPVDYRAVSTDTFYTAMEEKPSDTRRVEYLEPWFVMKGKT